MKIFIIKPQIVSIQDTYRALDYFRKMYPQAEISLLANVLEADYIGLSKNTHADRHFFYRPGIKMLTIWEMVKLFFKLNLLRFNLAVVLVGEPAAGRYKKAKLMAILTGARGKCQYVVRNNISTNFFIRDIRRYSVHFIGCLKYMLRFNKLRHGFYSYELKGNRIKGFFNRKKSPLIYFALFSGNSNVARFRKHNKYILKITNDAYDTETINLAVNIYSYISHRRHYCQYRYFVKKLSLEPKNTSEIKIDYDWENRISFQRNDVLFHPDGIWKEQEEAAEQFYSIQVELFDSMRKKIDCLEIFQKLEK